METNSDSSVRTDLLVELALLEIANDLRQVLERRLLLFQVPS
jgi:hypothetical protein